MIQRRCGLFLAKELRRRLRLTDLPLPLRAGEIARKMWRVLNPAGAPLG
jgi:hypothetical protein